MATLPQAPFWVPRPSDDFPASPPVEYQSSTLIHILTNLKFFGAGGQAATHRWLPQHVQDDSSFWQGSPTKSYIAFNNINFAMYGAMGQVPTRSWSRQLAQQDDSSLWGITPLKAAPIAELILPLLFLAGGNGHTAFNFTKQHQDDPQYQSYSTKSWLLTNLAIQKFYGAIGQGVTPTYTAFYCQDDAAPWSMPAPWFNTKLELYLGRPTLYGSPGQSLTPKWNWHYNADDSAAWNWFPTHVGGIGSLNFYPPPFNPNAVKPSFFVPSPNDQVYEWAGNRYGSWVIPAITNQHIIMPPIYAMSGGDSAAFWQGQATAKPNVPPAQGPRPLDRYPWQWSDDASVWQGVSSYSAIQRRLTTPPIKAPLYFQSGGDDSSTWRAEPKHNRTLFPPVNQATYFGVPGQSATFRPNFGLEDAPGWFPALANLIMPGSLTLIQPASQMGPAVSWAPDDEDQPALWSFSGQQSNQKVLSIPPTPPGKPSNQYPRGVWRIDDWVDPLFGPTTNRTMQGLLFPKVYGVGGQAPTHSYSRDYVIDDASTWQRTQYQNIIINPLITPVGFPPGSAIGFSNLRWLATHWNYNVDDPGWVGQPTEALSKQNFGKSFPPLPVPYFLWSGTSDVAESQWDAKPRFAYPALRPPISNVMPPLWFQGGGDISSFWVGEPIGKEHLNQGTAQGPKPLPVFPWQHTDDPAGWQFQQRYPTMKNILAAPTHPPAMPPQYFQSGGDHSSTWSWVPPANINTSIIQIVPAAILWIPDDEDTASIWVGSGVHVNPNLPGYVPAANAQMAPSILWDPSSDPDELSYWSGSGQQSNQKVLAIPPTPPGQPAGQYPRSVWRHDDPSGWQGQPTANQLLRYLALPRPGLGIAEAVPPPWQALTTQDDPAYWLGTPMPSSIINSVPQFFGQKGQAVPFRWNFTLDDPPMFQGAPSAAWPLSLLGQTKLFGQGGQVLPFRPNFTIDDPPMWQGAPATNPLAMLYVKTVYPPGQTTPGFFNLRWSAAPFNYDQDAVQWVGAPFSPDYILNVPAAPIPKRFDWLDFFRRGRRRQ